MASGDCCCLRLVIWFSFRKTHSCRQCIYYVKYECAKNVAVVDMIFVGFARISSMDCASLSCQGFSSIDLLTSINKFDNKPKKSEP